MLSTPGHGRCTQHARSRQLDRLSVRQDGCRARRSRQPEARLADHRIDRHGRRHEAVLRRRRRALPRHRECLAPDEGFGSQAVRRQWRHKSHRDPGRHRRHRLRDRQGHAACRASPQRDIYMALAKTPFGKPNKAKTWKDVNGKLPAHSDPRLRSAADQRHARRARRTDHDRRLRDKPRHGCAEEGR